MAEIQKEYAVESSGSDRVDNGVELRSWSAIGGTDHDENEMRMLGRTQELNVISTAAALLSDKLANTVRETFVLSRHLDLPAR